MTSIVEAIVLLAHLTIIALGTGLGFNSYHAYCRQGTSRLAAAAVGFAFLTMGIAGLTLTTWVEEWELALKLFELSAWIMGFSMLYIALYR